MIYWVTGVEVNRPLVVGFMLISLGTGWSLMFATSVHESWSNFLDCLWFCLLCCLNFPSPPLVEQTCCGFTSSYSLLPHSSLVNVVERCGWEDVIKSPFFIGPAHWFCTSFFLNLRLNRKRLEIGNFPFPMWGKALSENNQGIFWNGSFPSLPDGKMRVFHGSSLWQPDGDPSEKTHEMWGTV